MNFINLRNVANQEINESYSGILRISPYAIDGVLLDDPTPLLYTIGSKVSLSDSDGNFLNISFIPQIQPTKVIGNTFDGISEVNLINITQETSNLYCTESLHISPTLYIDIKDSRKSPVQIINKDGILLFPTEAPEDTSYLNHNGKLDFNVPAEASKNRINKVFDNLWADHEIYTSDEYEDYHVKVNGKKIYRLKPASDIIKDGKEELASMVPELYKHDYVLGQYAGHTYKPTEDDLNGFGDSKISTLPKSVKEKLLENSNCKITELSFIEIEKIIWSLLEGSMSGSYRSFEGRYKNLFPLGLGEAGEGTEDNLYNKLFYPFNATSVNDEELENTIKAHSPLVGLPVQSGIITYNAIPFRRFMFHALRRYDDIDTRAEVCLSENSEDKVSDYITRSEANAASSFMHNLTTEYALCDGRRIKEITEDEIITDYPAINTNSYNWSNWYGPEYYSAQNIYDAMSLSMAKPSGETNLNVLRTPRLFEMNQYSLRYLRGLNWRRVGEFEKVITKDNYEEFEWDWWPYNHENMVIESDGSFIINEWYDETSSIRPEVKYNKVESRLINNELVMRLPETALEDPANISKNIHQVGVHYANYDYKIAYLYRHIHQLVVDTDLLYDQDALYKVADYYDGTSNVYANPEFNNNIKNKWSAYVNLKDDSFLGTYVMRSIQNVSLESSDSKNLIKAIQDLPIAYRGGTTSSIRRIQSGYKGARVKFGRCTGNYHKNGVYYNADGGYELSAWRARQDGKREGWRFLSSLPVINKYGSYKEAEHYATANYNGTFIRIDDSLPKPPSINFIPLMKI